MGRKGNSGMVGSGSAPIRSNATVYDGISGLPSRIGSNQRWVLQREYAVEGGGTHRAFEGKGTYEANDHDTVARNQGFKSTSALKNAYKSRTESVKVGDQAWTGKRDSNGNMIWGKVTKNEYKPVLVTLGLSQASRDTLRGIEQGVRQRQKRDEANRRAVRRGMGL